MKRKLKYVVCPTCEGSFKTVDGKLPPHTFRGTKCKETAMPTAAELTQLRAYVQSIMMSAQEVQTRIDGDMEQSYVVDLLGDIRSDLERAEAIATKYVEL